MLDGLPRGRRPGCATAPADGADRVQPDRPAGRRRRDRRPPTTGCGTSGRRSGSTTASAPCAPQASGRSSSSARTGCWPRCGRDCLPEGIADALVPAAAAPPHPGGPGAAARPGRRVRRGVDGGLAGGARHADGPAGPAGAAADVRLPAAAVLAGRGRHGRPDRRRRRGAAAVTGRRPDAGGRGGRPAGRSSWPGWPRPTSTGCCANWSARTSPSCWGTHRADRRRRPHLQGPGLRLADRGGAARPAERRRPGCGCRRRCSTTTRRRRRSPRTCADPGRGAGCRPAAPARVARRRRADRDRRHGLPLPRRRRVPRGAVAAARRRGRRDRRRSPPTGAGTSTACTTRTRTRRHARYAREGGFLDDAGRVRRRASSASARARRWRWTRSSGCCWRPPGRRSNGPGSTRRSLRGSADRRVRRRDRPGLRPAPARGAGGRRRATC